MKGFKREPLKEDASSEERAEYNKELAKYAEPHGICVACMIHCHEGHEVHELYSKLDFRCDCGNGKFPYACKIDGSYEFNPNPN